MDDDRELLLISFFTFLTVALWIFFELVKTTKTTTVTPAAAQAIVPLTPTIDTDILTVLEEKQSYPLP
jgi:hypothetical protein